jgi:thiol:disulfide interchange protein DsbC
MRACHAIKWRMRINQWLQKVGRARVAGFVMLAVAMSAGGAATTGTTTAPPTVAKTISTTGNVSATIKQSVESRFPGSHVLDVQPAQIPGLYEVFMGDQIVYTDNTGDHLLMGPLVDTRTRQNLTQARLNERGRIDFNSLPLAQAIKVVKGNGSRTFAVFSDPDCPYCQQLEKSLLNVNDTTMYVFLYPIASLHPQAPVKAHAIWCASDRSAAWNKWMHDKALPPTKTCAADPTDDLQKLGEKLNINSTPTLFLSNGTRIAGAISDKELDKELTAAGVVRKAAK